MWHNLKIVKPEKSGQYLVVIDDGNSDVFAEVKHYFHKGEFITVKDSGKEAGDERVFDFLYNDELIVRAEKNGFYELSSKKFDAKYDKTINNNPYYDVYWSELPDAPIGKSWGRIGSDTL